LPDLSSNKFLSIDKGEYYPHHNLYYITHPDISQLKILASILMSDFVKNQLAKIGIKMSGGLPRFQSQTLKKLRIPTIDDFTNSEQIALIDAYDTKDFVWIDSVVDKYGIVLVA